jgi:hypothetical protein
MLQFLLRSYFLDVASVNEWAAHIIKTIIIISGFTALCWALAAFSVSWSYTQSVGLLGRGISPSQGSTQTSMPWAGFEPTNRVFERAKKVHALERAANVIGIKSMNKGKKGKAVPVIGREGPHGCESSRLPHLLDHRLTDGGEVVSLTRPPPLTPPQGHIAA